MLRRGFTLIELVLVIAIMAILTTYITLNWPGQGVNLRAQADQLAGDIRYAQALAYNRGVRYRINFINSTTYSISDTSGTVVVYTGNGTTTLSQATMTYTTSPLVFTTQGVPYSGATPTILSSNFVITLTSDGGTMTVTVYPETGRVLVQ